MLRPKGLLTIGIFLVIILALSYLFTDRWLEKRLENWGSSLVGAKVEIDGLDFSFTRLHLRWQRLQVTDPNDTWKNMIETGPTDVSLELLPLLSGKIIIRQFKVTGIQRNTRRETDGRLPEPAKEASSSSSVVEKMAQKLVAQTSQYTLDRLNFYRRKINVDSLLSALNLQSLTKMDSLKNRAQQIYQSRLQALNQLKLEDDTRKIEKALKSLQIKKLKTLPELQKSLTTIQTVRTRIDSLTRLIQDTKQATVADIQQLQESIRLIDDWIQADYRRALVRAKLPEISARNISLILFGTTVVSRVNKALYWIGKSREYSAKFQTGIPADEKPPRLKGQNIHFYRENTLPDFWIKNIEISGNWNPDLNLEGKIQNLVANQKLIGRPTTLSFKGSGTRGAQLSFEGLLNYLMQTPQETFQLQFTNFSLNNTRLFDSPLLPHKISSGKGRLFGKLSLMDQSLRAQIEFTGDQLQFDFTDSGERESEVQKILQSLLKDTRQINFKTNIFGKANRLNISISSNLDNLLAKRLREKVGEVVQKAQTKIRSAIARRVEPEKQKLEKLLATYNIDLTDRLGRYEEQLQKIRQMEEQKKKELEARIDKESGKLKDKLKDQLKKLF